MRSPGGGYALVCTPCLRYPVYYRRDKDTVRYWIGMIYLIAVMPILPTGGMININSTGIAWRYSTESRKTTERMCTCISSKASKESLICATRRWCLFLFELWVQAGIRELSKRRNVHQLSMFMLNWEDDKRPRWSNKNYNWTISSSNVLLYLTVVVLLSIIPYYIKYVIPFAIMYVIPMFIVRRSILEPSFILCQRYIYRRHIHK